MTDQRSPLQALRRHELVDVRGHAGEIMLWVVRRFAMVAQVLVDASVPLRVAWRRPRTHQSVDVDAEVARNGPGRHRRQHVLDAAFAAATYLLMLRLFCFDPNSPCRNTMGGCRGSRRFSGGECSAEARLRARLLMCTASELRTVALQLPKLKCRSVASAGRLLVRSKLAIPCESRRAAMGDFGRHENQTAPELGFKCL